MDNLTQTTAYPTGAPAPHQPYGIAIAPTEPLRKFRFLAFGIPYAVVNASIVGLLALVGIAVGSQADEAVRAGDYKEFRTVLITMVSILVAWAAVAAVASVFCFSGRVLGWWIGFVHTCLALAFFALVLVVAAYNEGSNAAGMVAVLVMVLTCAGVLALGVFDMKRYRAHRDAREEIEFREQRAQIDRAWTSPVDPLARRKQAVAPPVKRVPPDNTAAMQDAIQLIAAAVSTEPDLAAQRLARASQAAVQLLGPGADAIARQWLDKPMQVDDFESVLELLAPGVARNPRMAQMVLKCVQHALRDESKQVSPEAALLVNGLRARLLGGETA